MRSNVKLSREAIENQIRPSLQEILSPENQNPHPSESEGRGTRKIGDKIEPSLSVGPPPATEGLHDFLFYDFTDRSQRPCHIVFQEVFLRSPRNPELPGHSSSVSSCPTRRPSRHIVHGRFLLRHHFLEVAHRPAPDVLLESYRLETVRPTPPLRAKK